MSNTISYFKGNYRWLSNFERCQIYYNGVMYQCVESAYQAQKTVNEKVRWIFSNLDGREAKALGQEIHVRNDWEEVKLDVMHDLIWIKFNIPRFKQLLLATGDMEIIEGNYWGYTFWGVYRGTGENHLGKIIMDIREEIVEETKVKEDA